MKKHILSFLFAALLLLCACQPTPEEPIVLQKDQDMMIKKGTATLPPEAEYTPPEAPERYLFDYSEGTLTVHVDAVVTVPDQPLTIARVSADGYDQDAVKRLFALLADGDTMTTAPSKQRMSKEDIGEAIQRLMQMLEDGSYLENDWTEEQVKERIRELENNYKNAPFAEEQHRPTVADGTFYRDSQGEKTYDIADASSENRRFEIRSCPDGNGASRFRYRRSKSPSYSMCNAREVDADSELPEKLGMMCGEAMEQISAVLDATGEPFRVKRMYLIDDEQQGMTDGVYAEASHYALSVQCQRTFAGFPVAADIPEAWQSGDRYAIPWQEESLWIVIDREGIVSMNWIEPITVREAVADSNHLMSFSEIREIAEKMYRVIYLQYTDPQSTDTDRIEVELNVGHVDLELIRVREQDNVDGKKGLLIPAWVFYGTIRETVFLKDGSNDTYYSEYGLGGLDLYYQGDTITLCINAIDGSIIDPVRGY